MVSSSIIKKHLTQEEIYRREEKFKSDLQFSALVEQDITKCHSR